MAPPSYTELGKACRDVFEKGYNFGVFRLSTNHSTCGGVGFKTDVQHTFEDATFNGSIETKLKWPEYGLTCTKKWFTNNVLFAGLVNEDKIYPGVKLGLEGYFAPDTGEKSGTVIAQYKHDMATLDLDFNLDDKEMGVNTGLTLGYQGWLAGAKGMFDAGEGAVKNYSFMLGHSYGDVQAGLRCDNLNTFRGSIYQRVTNRLESGIVFGWCDEGAVPAAAEAAAEGIAAVAPTKGLPPSAPKYSSPVKYLAIAGRYLIDPCSSIRGKFNSDSILGIGYESTVRDGLTVNFSANFDLKDFNGGGHKIGIGMEFEQ